MKKFFKRLILVLAVSAVGYIFFFMWKQSQPAPEIYEVVQPSVRDISNIVVATGTLEPRVEVELKPKVTGVIEDLKVKPGDIVRKGDVVATISVIPDMSMLNQAKSSVEVAHIALNQIEIDAKRSQILFESGVISKSDNEQMQTKLSQARESLLAACSQVEVITSGVSNRSGDANNTIVRSTMNGTVLSVPVKTGSTVSGSSQFSEGTTIAKVGNLNDVIFRGFIDEIQVAKLNVGMKASLVPGAMQDISIPALLEYISPEGTLINGTRKFEVKASASVPEDVNVRSGYSVSASIELQKAIGVLSVDEVCVSFEEGSPYVYRLISSKDDSDHQKWERIPVSLGISDGLFVEIKDGVSADMMIRGMKK